MGPPKRSTTAYKHSVRHAIFAENVRAGHASRTGYDRSRELPKNGWRAEKKGCNLSASTRIVVRSLVPSNVMADGPMRDDFNDADRSFCSAKVRHLPIRSHGATTRTSRPKISCHSAREPAVYENEGRAVASIRSYRGAPDRAEVRHLDPIAMSERPRAGRR